MICGTLVLGALGIAAYIKIVSKLELKFANRSGGANILADVLNDRIEKIKSHGPAKVVVLGIPRGGVITADIIAKKISADFDIINVMKLGAPHNKEMAIGAIAEDGTTYLNYKLIKESHVPDEYIKNETFEVNEEVRNNYRKYPGSIMDRTHKIKNSTILLVDDGAVSGATLIAATRSIKKYNPEIIIIAVPVALHETIKLFKKEVNYVEVISQPSSGFKALSQYYQEFMPVTESEIITLLHKRRAA